MKRYPFFKLKLLEITIWSIFFIFAIVFADSKIKQKRILYRSTDYEKNIPTDSWGDSPIKIEKRTNTKFSNLKVVTHKNIFIDGEEITFKNNVFSSYEGNQFYFKEYDLNVNYNFYDGRLFFILINGSHESSSSKPSTEIIINKYGFYEGVTDPIDVRFTNKMNIFSLYKYDASLNKNEMHITFYSFSYEKDNFFKIIYLYKPILREIKSQQL